MVHLQKQTFYTQDKLEERGGDVVVEEEAFVYLVDGLEGDDYLHPHLQLVARFNSNSRKEAGVCCNFDQIV
jgi:hypothetical protein